MGYGISTTTTMEDLELHDQRHLEAAQGWCELHVFTEADAELDYITASLRAHPKVLEVRWQIYANLEKWAVALEIANAIVKLVPDWPSGWGGEGSWGIDRVVPKRVT